MMTADLDLKALERRAWTSYLRDGLFDIFFGLMMLTMALRSLTDNVWFTLLIVPSVLVVIVGKRVITVPRLGRVRFSTGRLRRQHLVRMGVVVAVLATFGVLMAVLSGQELPSKYVRAVIVALCFLSVFGLMGYLMDFPRFYLYGLFWAIGGVTWELYGKPAAPILHAALGIVTLAIGAVALAQFLRKHPRPSPEGMYENAR